MARILCASDHAGFEAKEFIKKIIKGLDGDWEVVDLGCESGEISVDYPDFAVLMASEIKAGDLGILICGSGIGISIAANRHSQIRAALCHNATSARLAREHNDANILCFGARMVGSDVMADMLKAFLQSQFLGGRHEKRVQKLAQEE